MEQEDMTKWFMQLLEAVPLSDIVGAAVLVELSQKNAKLFTSLMQGLRAIEPRTESIKKGTKVMMHMEDIGHVNIEFDSDFDSNESSFIADYLPYSILSQVAGYPMGRDYEDENEHDEIPFQQHLDLIHQIASDPHLFIRPNKKSFLQMNCYENYDWDGVGQIINGKEGIIEAIVQSIQKSFTFIPGDMKLLYECGFRENNFTLLYRFYLALYNLSYSTEPTIAEEAKTYVRLFHRFFTDFMAKYLSKEIESTEEQKALYNSLKKMNIEEGLDKLFLE